MVVRILLGLAEGPVFPASAQVVSLWIPKRERTLASCCFDCCARIGSAAAPPVVTWLIITYSWQASFIVTGVIAIVYTFVWFAIYREPDRHPKLSKEELAYIRQDEVVNESGKVVTTRPIPMFMLFTYKKTLFLFAGYFCYMYYWNMYISWMPAYLVEARGLDLKQMGVGAMIPYLCAIPCEICGGAFFDFLTKKGMSLSAVRRLGMTICLAGGALTLFLAVQSTSPIACVAMLTLSMSVFSFGASNIWTIPNDIAPYGQAGSVGAAYSFCGQISGIAAPGISGFLIAAGLNSGNIVSGYDNAFYVMILVTLLGIVFFVANDYSRLVPRNAEAYTVEHL
jgi:ACS family glucarate transporter-like MFS transporter